MPAPNRSKKSGKRRKSKSSSDSGLAIGLGVLGVLLVIGIGVLFMLPRNSMTAIKDSVAAVVPIAATRPATHEDHLRAVLDAEREHARVMSTIKDKQSADEAIPVLLGTLMKTKDATNQWLEFIKLNPISPQDSLRIFLERSTRLREIQKEFPYDLAFGGNVEILTALGQVSSEQAAASSASRELTTALNAASGRDPGRLMPSAGADAFANQPFPRGNSPAITANAVDTSGSPTASASAENTEPPVHVPVPRTDVNEKHGAKAVTIRLHGVKTQQDAAQFAQRLVLSLGGGQFEATTATSEGAYFVVIAPINNVEEFLNRLEKICRLLNYDGNDELKKLANVIVAPENQRPGLPFVPPGLPGGKPQ